MISRMSLRVRLNVERAIFRAFPSEVIFRQARYEKSKQFIRSDRERGAWFSPRSRIKESRQTQLFRMSQMQWRYNPENTQKRYTQLDAV